MARLSATERAGLPDRAFAYIDSQGNRRLPIHDASHVRNALARFNQVGFESDEARDRARERLLRAAQRHGIVPIGFMSRQLRARRRLPEGDVTFLMTDLEASTALLARLGDGYTDVLRTVRNVVRGAIRASGGVEVDARGDDHFAAFQSPAAALEAALAVQRAMAGERWPGGGEVRLRIGLHRGRPTLTDTGYVGLSVHTAARICFAGHGGQILLSAAVRSHVADSPAPGLVLTGLGAWRFRGLPDPLDLFQVDEEGRLAEFPPLRSAERAR